MPVDFLDASYCIRRAASDVGADGAVQFGGGGCAIFVMSTSSPPQEIGRCMAAPPVTLALSLEGPLLEVANVRQRALDRGSCRHRRAQQVGASAAALTAFEVAVRCRVAALAGFDPVG